MAPAEAPRGQRRPAPLVRGRLGRPRGPEGALQPPLAAAHADPSPPPLPVDMPELAARDAAAALSAAAGERFGDVAFETACHGELLGDGDPVVIVLGWYGAQLRHVKKYCEALGEAVTSQGRCVAVLTSVCPKVAVMAPTDRWRRNFADKCLGAVETSGLVGGDSKRPLYVFVFSNGGAFVLKEMQDRLRDPQRFPCCAVAFAGAAFDSAPCYLHPMTGVRAVTEGQPAWVKPFVALLFTSLSLPAGFFWDYPRNFWRAWEQAPDRRELFLFSEVDPLCDHLKLAALVEARRAAGARAERREFVGSKHVQHMRTYPDEYKAALGDWLLAEDFGRRPQA